MEEVFTLIINICVLSNFNAQTKIEISDFKVLNNTNWKGTLTFKNYSDGKQVTLKKTLSILVTKNKIITKIKFPNEPKANSKKIIKIKRKGTYFGNEKVIKKEVVENGIIKITASYKGNDNNKKANINNIYMCLIKIHFLSQKK
jgi:hypothetical protein